MLMRTGIIYVRYNMCAFFLYLWFFLCFFIRFLLIQHILCVVFDSMNQGFSCMFVRRQAITIVLEQIREPISNQYLTINIILHICILYVQNKFYWRLIYMKLHVSPINAITGDTSQQGFPVYHWLVALITFLARQYLKHKLDSTL